MHLTIILVLYGGLRKEKKPDIYTYFKIPQKQIGTYTSKIAHNLPQSYLPVTTWIGYATLVNNVNILHSTMI